MIHLLVLSLLLSTQLSFAACITPSPGTRLWNVVVDDFLIDCETLSKICIIESKIDRDASACAATPIITDNPTISTEGYYCLAQNITGTIIITVDNVVIDLNNHVIDGGANGISIDSNLSNITIRNGTINGTTEEGILVNQGCSRINLENLSLNNCAVGTALGAIVFEGTGSNQISNCYVSNVKITNSHGGIYVQNIDGLTIRDYSISDCAGTDAVAGIILFGDGPSTPTRNVLIQNCFISTLTSFVGPNPNNLTAGILGATTENVTIDGCIVEDLLSSGFFSAGFVFISSSCITISNSSACMLECTSTEGATGFTFLNTENILLDHCTTQSVTARGPAGFNLENCPDVTCRNCLVQNVRSNATGTISFEGALGFKFNITSGPIKGISLENCIAKDIQGGDFGGSTGFVIRGSGTGSVQEIFTNDIQDGIFVGTTEFIVHASSGSVHDIFFNSCAALDIANTNTLTASAGFVIIDASDITCNNLLAQTIAGNANNVGFVMQNAENIILNDLSTQDISDGLTSSGLVLINCSNITSNNVLAQSLSGNEGNTGLFIGNCQNLTLQDITCQAITGTQSNGISVSSSQNVLVQNASVQTLFGRFSAAYRFRDLESILIDQCASNNIVSDQATGPLSAFEFLRVSSGAIYNCNSNSVQNLVAGGAEGFSIAESHDLIFDFCRTSSNFTVGSGSANGFSVGDSSNIFFDNCTSSYNIDSAFRIAGDSVDCIVGNCTAVYSGIGFEDLSPTSTFYDNVAAKNSTTNYSGGIPFVVAQGSATITGGNASI